MTLAIGPYSLKNPWILAPMAGVSEMPFRLIALEMGASAAPTELISAKGLIYGQDKTKRYLKHGPQESPFWVQLFGGDAESMAEGARLAVELGADILDVNMGCPVKKVTKNGAGSALLTNPSRAAAIVEAMVKASGVPVTVKIRSGWDANTTNYVEMARAVADAGACAIAMHGRTRQQGYSGKADWSAIAELAAKSPIPVIGNGDASTPEAARRMMQETGCQAVMIGRGALGNPWIFSALAKNAPDPTGPERWAIVQRHLSAHIDHMGDVRRGIRKFRQHLAWYAHGLHSASQFRKRVMTVTELDELRDLCEAFFSGALQSSDESSRDFEMRGALG